jgi:hypothetical protein
MPAAAAAPPTAIGGMKAAGAAVIACVRATFIGVLISGPIASSDANKPKNEASLMGKVRRVFKMLLPVDPSPGNPVVDEVEVRPRSFRKVLSNDVDVVVDAAGDARFCSDEVIAELSCDSADCTPLPVAVPLAWVTAAAWLAAPAGLVVDGGAVNVVNVDAAAEVPA